MKRIKGVAVTRVVESSAEIGDHIYPMNVTPTDIAAYTEIAATTNPVTHTLTGKEIIEIIATDYPVRFRFLTATDTVPVTSSNARKWINAGDYRDITIPDDAVAISVVTIDGSGKVIIEEYGL